MRQNMEIKELHNYTQKEYENLRQLMSELSDRLVMTQMDLMSVLRAPDSHLYVMTDDGKIIGCATLCVFYSPSGTKASIEDVVVASAYRGRRLGRQLVEHLLKEAKEFAPIEIQLTSKPVRFVANKLYQSLGFERKETNCYRMSVLF